VAFGRPLVGQSGELNDSTEYAVILGTWVNNHPGPLRAVVLWRGPRGWRQPEGAAKERADSVFRLENLRARQAGRSFFGIGMAYGILDPHVAAVTVEGQRFPLDRTDSALVIMVAIPASDKPRAVTTARIAVGAVPDDFWPGTAPTGDVLFGSSELLRNALTRVPAIGAFLR
jgi:hypothetical protein